MRRAIALSTWFGLLGLLTTFAIAWICVFLPEDWVPSIQAQAVDARAPGVWDIHVDRAVGSDVAWSVFGEVQNLERYLKIANLDVLPEDYAWIADHLVHVGGPRGETDMAIGAHAIYFVVGRPMRCAWTSTMVKERTSLRPPFENHQT
jgi:hypothetical protein